MKPISFSDVNTRKLNLQSECKREKISFRTVSNNLNVKNLLLFTESAYDNINAHCKRSFLLYDRLLNESGISDQDKDKIEYSILSNLKKVSNIDSIYKTISSTNIENKELFFDSLEILENCDRIIRNETKLLKRFDLNKIINENIMHGCRHTVFELCSLLDTYSISPKAKLNIALENVSYALFKSRYDINLNEVTEYIVEYFLTRESVITDKEYNGYTEVLKNNRFINSDADNISYVFDSKENLGFNYADKTIDISSQCEKEDYAQHISKSVNIKTEDEASSYIDNTIDLILKNETSKNDAKLLLKSIYSLPLIGNISQQFINYKMEMSQRKLKIKEKLTGVDNEKLVRKVLNDGEMLEFAQFVSETVKMENYILDDSYIDEINPIKILEAENNSDDIKDILNTFKANNQKDSSKFKNMISRIMTKSPENIIDATPNIFGTVRIMLYLGITAATGPLGPIFAAITALINKLITMHLDLKQAEKLLSHLKSEKGKAEKKLDKLSGKEKDNQQEYIKCIDDNIKKVKQFISKIDDENENLDDFDDDFGDFNFNFESASFEFAAPNEVLKMLADSPDEEILSTIAPLFDNCSNIISNSFYKLVEDKTVNESAILENKGNNKVETDREEPSFLVQYEAAKALQGILNEAINNTKTVKYTKTSNLKNKKKPSRGTFNLNTINMAMVNFKKKIKNLKGKEQELWRNIDIATSNLYRGFQQALTSDRREAIIKGSIIPSFSKCIKSAIAVGAVGIFTGPVGAAITAVGMFGASKYLNERERKLLYDEIDTELQVVEKQIQMAENEGNMNQYRFLLNYQKKLSREKFRIKYGIHMSGRTIPELKGGNN